MENLTDRAGEEMAAKCKGIFPRHLEPAVRERRDGRQILIAREVGRVGVDRELDAGLAAVRVEDLAANSAAGLIDACHAVVDPGDNETPVGETRDHGIELISGSGGV